MTYPTVTNTVVDAQGTPLVGGSVVITLVGGPGFSTDAQNEVSATTKVTTNSSGTWTAVLKPNALVTPANTYYQVIEPSGLTTSFVVPNDSATHWLNAIATTSPTAPAASLGNVRYDVDQTTTLTTAQQAQARANIGAGTGGGAVASVFGRTGAVVAQTGDYTAAQVGADAAGAAAAEQTRALAAEALLIPLSQKGAASGVATLDSGGHIPNSQLPTGAMEYQGTWNAATNTPTLANGTGRSGDVYVVSVAGSTNFGAGAIAFQVGDRAMYNGSTWQRGSAPDGVSSVAGRLGDVVLTHSDITDWATATIAESQVTGLVTDLAGKVPTTRQLAGLDLSTDRPAAALKTALGITEADVANLVTDLAAKIALSTVTAKGDLIVATASGAVTRQAVGADGTVLTADSTQADGVKWAAAAGGSSSFGDLFGDGSDGAVTISSNTTLTRDMYYSSLTVNAGVTLNPNGFRIFVSGTATINGTISVAGGNGTPSSGSSGGNNGARGGADNGSVGFGPDGGTGSITGNGGSANTWGAFPQGSITAADQTGGQGGTGSSGTGGTGSQQFGGGSKHMLSGFRAAADAIAMCGWCSSGAFAKVGGGPGAGGGAGDGTNRGGGGGGGGGVILLAAKIFAGTGTLTAKGGDGGAAGTGNTGGGGGGAGGAVVVVTTNNSGFSGTITAAAGVGAAGSGTGTAGATGSAGAALTLLVA